MSEQAQLLEALSAALERVDALTRELHSRAEEDGALVIAPGQLWATGKQLARRYAVSEEWVAARPRELGAAPISDCQNSKLRYYLATADAYMAERMRGSARRVSRRRSASRAAGRSTANVPHLAFV